MFAARHDHPKGGCLRCNCSQRFSAIVPVTARPRVSRRSAGRLWIPYPLSNANQKIANVCVTGNFTSSEVHREADFGNSALYAEWKGTKVRPTLSYSFTATRKEAVTKAQHCWAEFYEPGYGWVVVDPADVRKAILEKERTVEDAKPLNEDLYGFNIGYAIRFREL